MNPPLVVVVGKFPLLLDSSLIQEKGCILDVNQENVQNVKIFNFFKDKANYTFDQANPAF